MMRFLIALSILVAVAALGHSAWFFFNSEGDVSKIESAILSLLVALGIALMLLGYTVQRSRANRMTDDENKGI